MPRLIPLVIDRVEGQFSTALRNSLFGLPCLLSGGAWRRNRALPAWLWAYHVHPGGCCVCRPICSALR